MKQQLLRIIVILVTSTGKLFGQCTCLDVYSFTTNQDRLNNIYKSINSVHDPESIKRGAGVFLYSGMPKEFRLVSDENEKFGISLNKELLKAGILLDKISWIEVIMYLNKEGKADYFFCDFPKSTLSDLSLQPIKDTLCNWAKSYQSSLFGKESFKSYSQFNLSDRLFKISNLKKKQFAGYLGNYHNFMKTSRPDTVTYLNISREYLAKIPKRLKKFTSLKILDLSDNEIQILPKFVSKLSKLDTLILVGNRLIPSKIKFKRNHHITYINLQFNRLTGLPKSLAKNKKLKSLWLGHNDLGKSWKPSLLRRLKSLEDLNLYNAGLTRVPIEISALANLKILDLYYNKLSYVPIEISQNKKLQKLALSYNDIGSLPNEISQLENLQELYVRSNSLTDLPPSISGLTKLSTLDISDNAFDILPTSITQILSLRTLNISKNKLRALPEKIIELPFLKELDISEIHVKKEPNAGILNFVKKLQSKQINVLY